jgi:hypothetical protein
MKYKLKANTLPLSIVISVIMLIMVLGILLLWEMDFLHFSQQNFIKQQQANIKSTLTLYNNYPSIIDDAQDSAFVQLYDSIATSQMLVEREQWGLYEIVSISSANRKTHQTYISGLDSVYRDDLNFYYQENKSTLTLTGKTNINGNTSLPQKGIIYGQINSVFFSGKKIDNSKMRTSKELPEPNIKVKNYIEHLFSSHGWELINSDSLINVDFYNNQIRFLSAQNSNTTFYALKGKIIITGDEITVSANSILSNIIIVGQKITVNSGFSGVLQIFSSDTIIIEDNVKLNYPSGVFSKHYIKIGDNSQINGYVIVDNNEKIDPRKANYIQSRKARIRGLLYIRGAAQLQGIVSGCAYLARAVFYSPQGYYNDMIYDASIIENREMAYPLWFNNTKKRKTIKCIK